MGQVRLLPASTTVSRELILHDVLVLCLKAFVTASFTMLALAGGLVHGRHGPEASSCSSKPIQGWIAQLQCISSQCKPPAIKCDVLPCFGLQLEDTSLRQPTQRDWLWEDWPFRGCLLG